MRMLRRVVGLVLLFAWAGVYGEEAAPAAPAAAPTTESKAEQPAKVESKTPAASASDESAEGKKAPPAPEASAAGEAVLLAQPVEEVAPSRFDNTLTEGVLEEGPVARTYRYFGRLPDSTRFQGTKGAGERFPLAALAFSPVPNERVHTVGPVRLTGSVALSERYTDNVFLTSDNKKEDWDTSASASVGAEVGDRNATFGMRYNVKGYMPENTWKENARVDQELITSAGWRPHSSLRFSFVDVFGRRSISSNGQGEEAQQYIDNSSTFTVAYAPIEAWTVEATFDHYFAIFDDKAYQSDDYYADTFRLNLYRRIMQKIWLFVYMSGGWVTNRNDPGANTDNNDWGGGVGITWSPRKDFNGRVEVGYQLKDYHSNAWEDEETVTCSGVINYQATRKLSLHATAQRSIYETSSAGDNAANGPAMNRTEMALTGKYQFNSSWSASAQLFGGYDDYQTADTVSGKVREDWLYGGVFAIYWTPRPWLVFNLQYQYQHNDSNVDQQGFIENSVTLGGRFAF